VRERERSFLLNVVISVYLLVVLTWGEFEAGRWILLIVSLTFLQLFAWKEACETIES
jgi:diacylglycerol kinase